MPPRFEFLRLAQCVAHARFQTRSVHLVPRLALEIYRWPASSSQSLSRIIAITGEGGEGGHYLPKNNVPRTLFTGENVQWGDIIHCDTGSV